MQRRAVGNLLRNHREAAGLSRQALAAAAGVGARTIARIELAEGPPRLATLEALARALGIPVTALLEEEKAPERKRQPGGPAAA